MAERWQTSEGRVAACWFGGATTGAPLTGLTPTATVQNKDGTTSLVAATVVEVGQGFYRVVFGSLLTKDSLVLVDGGSSLTTERYVPLEVPVGGYVDGLATATAVAALAAAVGSPAQASVLTALATTVGTPAQAAALTAVASAVGQTATTAGLQALATTVGSPAQAAALTALSTVVGTPAQASALSAVAASIAALNGAVAGTALEASVQTLLGRLTALRAANLDAAVSSRATPADVAPNVTVAAPVTYGGYLG